MRGWIYVITHSARPDELCMGFSARDPQVQTREFENTSPIAGGEYRLAYDVLVHHAEGFQEELFIGMESRRRPDGWLKMSVAEAVTLIRNAVGDKLLVEQEAEREAEASKPVPREGVEGADTAAGQEDPEPQRKERRSIVGLLFPDVRSVALGIFLLAFFLLTVHFAAPIVDPTLGWGVLGPLAVLLALLWTYPARVLLLGDGTDKQADSDAVPEKVVASCPHCSKRMRVPAGKALVVTCPACQGKFQYGG